MRARPLTLGARAGASADLDCPRRHAHRRSDRSRVRNAERLARRRFQDGCRVGTSARDLPLAGGALRRRAADDHRAASRRDDLASVSASVSARSIAASSARSNRSISSMTAGVKLQALGLEAHLIASARCAHGGAGIGRTCGRDVRKAARSSNPDQSPQDGRAAVAAVRRKQAPSAGSWDRSAR